MEEVPHRTSLVPLAFPCFAFRLIQGHKSAQGILHLRNPNLGPNSGKQILDTRILDPNSWVKLFDSVFSSKRGPLKNSPVRNSRPKIHLLKFNPEIGPKNSHCTSAGPFCISFNRGGNRRAFRPPGAGGDHYHSTMEPLPGHIRCRYTHAIIVSQFLWGIAIPAFRCLSNYHAAFPDYISPCYFQGFFVVFFQESPRQTKPKKGPKRKVHEFRPFL